MLNETQTKDVEKLFELGAHLGHKKNRLHPKARKNVYQMINGTSIIDLTKTIIQLEEAKKYLKEQAKNGKKMLVVGTKKSANTFIREFGDKNKISYIATKWLPGLLTNFTNINKNVTKLKEQMEFVETEEFKNLVKHERTKMQKHIAKLQRLYSGILNMDKKPDLLLIVDIKKEKNAVKEALYYKIPIVAIADTNGDPSTVTYPIVANDDDTTVVEYIMKQLLESFVSAIEEPKKEAPKKEEPSKKEESAKKEEPAIKEKEVKTKK